MQQSRSRFSWQNRRFQLLGLLLVLLLAALTLIILYATHKVFQQPPISPPPTSIAPCNRPDPNVPDPNGPHGLFVNAALRTFQAYPQSEQILLRDPEVCGLDLIIPWSFIDRGPSASPQYDWSFIDNEARPWIQARKMVALIVWGVAEQTKQEYQGQPDTPQYVLNQVPVIRCGNGTIPPTPVYWEPGYYQNYEKFVRALVTRYDHAPWVSYIRVGIGTGDEMFPANGLNEASCLQQWRRYVPGGNLQGFYQLWGNYVQRFLAFEHSLGSPKPFITALNKIDPSNRIPDAAAATSAADGIGVGFNGYNVAQANDYIHDPAACFDNWCRLFQQYDSRVPTELQTVGVSDPTGQNQTGSLTQWLPLAIQTKQAQIFEIYIQDWLVAEDPQLLTKINSREAAIGQVTNYQSAYQRALANAAHVVG
jgi:hypothetical protein